MRGSKKKEKNESCSKNEPEEETQAEEGDKKRGEDTCLEILWAQASRVAKCQIFSTKQIF